MSFSSYLLYAGLREPLIININISIDVTMEFVEIIIDHSNKNRSLNLFIEFRQRCFTLNIPALLYFVQLHFVMYIVFMHLW